MTNFQSSHFVLSIKFVGLSVSMMVFELSNNSLCGLFLWISSAVLPIWNVVLVVYLHVLIESLAHWMKFLCLFFIPGVRKNFPLLVVRVEDDLKSSSSSMRALSIYYSNFSSKNSVVVLFALVILSNRPISSTPNMTKISLTDFPWKGAAPYIIQLSLYYVSVDYFRFY